MRPDQTLYVVLAPSARDGRGGPTVQAVLTGPGRHAVEFPVERLTPAAFSRVERTLVAGLGQETCDRPDCDAPVGVRLVHLDGLTEETTVPFYVTGDGRALCERHGEPR